MHVLSWLHIHPCPPHGQDSLHIQYTYYLGCISIPVLHVAKVVYLYTCYRCCISIPVLHMADVLYLYTCYVGCISIPVLHMAEVLYIYTYYLGEKPLYLPRKSITLFT